MSALAAATEAAIRVLDDHGCLTVEAMCFADELDPDRRAVVERHAHACAICAQQQASLATAAQRVRRSRPRVTVPADARIAARQAVLRALMLRRRRLDVAPKEPEVQAAAAEDTPHVRRRRLLLLLGLGAALLGLGAVLLVALV